MLGNRTKSPCSNQHKITFNNSIVKKVHLSSLRIEDSTLGMPIEESVLIEVETISNETTNEEPNNEDSDAKDDEDATFLIDTASAHNLFNSFNKEDNSIIEDAEISISYVNTPANTLTNNNNALNSNNSLEAC